MYWVATTRSIAQSWECRAAIVVEISLHCCNIVELKWGILSLSPSPVCAQPNNALQRFPPRFSPLSISPSITLPHTDRSTKKENAHTLILKNPVKKKDEGFPAHSSLHLFLCRLSVLIRPSVISASIYLAFCRLWITSPHPTPSFCVCLPLSCLPWWKEMRGVALLSTSPLSRSHLT